MTDPRATKMSENELLDHVRRITIQLGLLVHHAYDSRRSDPGLPDLIILSPKGVLWRELKTEKGRLRPMQARWLETLTRNGSDAGVWRPTDLINGTIVRELRALK